MAEHLQKLDAKILVGWELHSTFRRARPAGTRWIQRSGFEWLCTPDQGFQTALAALFPASSRCSFGRLPGSWRAGAPKPWIRRASMAAENRRRACPRGGLPYAAAHEIPVRRGPRGPPVHPGHCRGQELHDRRHPQGDDPRVLKSIHAGAVKAEQELAAQGIQVKLFWKGPLREDDRDQQIQVVENFTSRRAERHRAGSPRFPGPRRSGGDGGPRRAFPSW